MFVKVGLENMGSEAQMFGEDMHWTVVQREELSRRNLSEMEGDNEAAYQGMSAFDDFLDGRDQILITIDIYSLQLMLYKKLLIMI